MTARRARALALLAAALLASAAGAAAAQSATSTRATTTVQPPVRPAPMRQDASPSVAPLPTRPEQRRQPAPIAKPHPPTQSRDSAPSSTPARERPRVQAATSVKVYDRRGRMLGRMRQAGPNRVLDTSTGRYYDTAPSGDGQRIIDPAPHRDD